MFKQNIFALIFFYLFFTFSLSSAMITIGPMVNFYFGKQTRITYTIEGAYWFVEHVNPYDIGLPPIGIDLGFEFGKNYKTIYTELETGIGTFGMGIGPCLLMIDDKTYFAPQLTTWANMYVGAGYRLRRFNSNLNHGVTAYGKILLDNKLNWID